MIPWGLIGTCTSAIETFVQFALRAGWSQEKIVETLQEHLNPETFAKIVQMIMEETAGLISFLFLGGM